MINQKFVVEQPVTKPEIQPAPRENQALHPLLAQIYATQTVVDRSGNSYELFECGVTPEQGQFMWNLIRREEIQRTIEIGGAYGLSSLFICDALSKQPTPSHTIVDPFQSTEWHGIGTYHLEQAGFSFFDLIEQPSELALPQLLQREERFDFAFIDGYHTFDHALVDFFYLNRLIKVGGIIVIDDCALKPINRLLRYISNYPNYSLVGTVTYEPSRKQRLLDAVKKGLSRVVAPLPKQYITGVLDDSIVHHKPFLAGNVITVALRKTGPDERHWMWYEPF